jgi:hypothetical protein
MDIFSVVLGGSLVDVNVFKFFHMGKCRGEFHFCNFFVALKEAPRVWFPSGPNSMSAVRGEDGLSAGTMSNK